MGYRATSNYYREESNTYDEAYGLILTNDEAILIVKKILRHYKAGMPNIRFYGNRDSGSMGYGELRLSNNPSIGLIIHELGHALKPGKVMREALKNIAHKGTSHHGLRFQVCICRIHTWAKTKGHWQEEILRRRAKEASRVKQVVVEEKELENPENLLRKKIEDARKKIKKNEDAKVRYEKKIRRLRKLYATKTKKLNRSNGALKRALANYESSLAEVEI